MTAHRRELTIVVAGAGPVGLLFALRLARENAAAGLRLRIVDAGAPPRWQAEAVDPRVYALSRESQRLLGDLWAVVAAKRVSPYRRMQVFEGEDPAGQGSIVFEAAEIGEPDLGHIVEDNLLRRVLLEALGRSGVETVFGSGVESIRLEDGRQTLVTTTGDALHADPRRRR